MQWVFLSWYRNVIVFKWIFLSKSIWVRTLYKWFYKIETKEAELEVTQTPDSKGESNVQNKLLSDEEQAGVPLETEQGQDEVAPVRVNLSSWDPVSELSSESKQCNMLSIQKYM